MLESKEGFASNMAFSVNNQPRIIYMGTPEISAIVLRGMIEAGFNIVALITNEDKPVGRKKELEPTPTKKVAATHHIPVYQPHRIREDNAFLKDIPCDIIVTMAYGQIVPKEVLDHPSIGCINLHGSLLPKLRGAAPIQRSIMEGDKVTGVTLMQMVDKMDAGVMYDKKEVIIEDNDNYTSLSTKIGEAAKDLIVEDLLKYANGKLPGLAQKEEEVTFAAKIKPSDEHLSLDMEATDLVNMIRGLSLTPGGYFLLEGKKLKVFGAVIDRKGEEAPIGTILSLKKGVFLQAKGAVLSLSSLQLEGKKSMDAKSFANGNQNLLGKVLE